MTSGMPAQGGVSSLRSLSQWKPVVCYEGVFSPEECWRILGYFTEPQTGTVAGRHNPAIRRSEVQRLTPNESNRWLYEKLVQQISTINQLHYEFDLAGFTEPLQLTRYASGGFYDWHLDLGNNRASIRKLSFIVQLVDGATYDGGEVEIRSGNRPITLPKGQGTMALFPSYILHRVNPVSRGVRQSLVGWIGGHHLR